MVKSIAALALCLLVCLGVGYAGSFVTAAEIPNWYQGLTKPAWTPPPVVFPVVWTVLYILMALALWRLWDRTPSSPARTRALTLFGVQLVLNAIWTPVFFGMHAPRAGLAVILALLVAIATTIAMAWKADQFAAWLLVPYAAWVAFASVLNAAVAVMN